MALNYVSTDRDQPFLLPPSVRDWLPERHLAWFVLEVVERLDTSRLHARHPNVGAGRAAYDPDMLVGLLLYAYCAGVRSSRRIEQLCEVDVAYRVLAANQVPDHTTIARFRQACDPILPGLFLEVLGVCARAGLAAVGVVAVDGTKMMANASKAANADRARLEAVVRGMLDEAARVDAEEDERFGDARGDELAPEFADPKTRGAAITRALEELRRRETIEVPKRGPSKHKAQARVARAEAALERIQREQAEHRSVVEARAQAEGRKPKGPVPTGENIEVRRARASLEAARTNAAATPAPKIVVNVTDPASRLMPVTGGGFVQGYNAQAAVNEHGIVLAGTVVQDTGDVEQCEPMMQATTSALHAAGVDDDIGVMLFDAGYWSENNITAPGPKRLIADANRRRLAGSATTEDPPPDDASPADKMRHRLRSPAAKKLYARRGAIVEPVFGQHKHDRGIRTFARRGLDAVRAEWQLINLTHNLAKLHRTSITPA